VPSIPRWGRDMPISSLGRGLSPRPNISLGLMPQQPPSPRPNISLGLMPGNGRPLLSMGSFRNVTPPTRPLLGDLGNVTPPSGAASLVREQVAQRYPEWSGSPLLIAQVQTFSSLLGKLEGLRKRFIEIRAEKPEAEGDLLSQLEEEEQQVIEDIRAAQAEIAQLERENPALTQPSALGPVLPLIEREYSRRLETGEEAAAKRERDRAIEIATSQQQARQEQVPLARERMPEVELSQPLASQAAPSISSSTPSPTVPITLPSPAPVPPGAGLPVPQRSPSPRPNISLGLMPQQPPLQMGISGRATPTAPMLPEVTAGAPLTGRTMPIASTPSIPSVVPATKAAPKGGLIPGAQSQTGMIVAPSLVLLKALSKAASNRRANERPERPTMGGSVPDWSSVWIAPDEGEPPPEEANLFLGVDWDTVRLFPNIWARWNSLGEEARELKQEKRRLALRNLWPSARESYHLSQIYQGMSSVPPGQQELFQDQLQALEENQALERATRRAEEEQLDREIATVEAEQQALQTEYPWLTRVLETEDPLNTVAVQALLNAGETDEAYADLGVALEEARQIRQELEIGGEDLTATPTSDEQYLSDLGSYMPQTDWQILQENADPATVARFLRSTGGVRPLIPEEISDIPMGMRQPTWAQYMKEQGITIPNMSPQTYLDLPGPYTPGHLGEALVQTPYATDEMDMRTEAEKQWEQEQGLREKELAQRMQIAQMEAELERQQMAAQVGQTVAQLASQNWAAGMPYALPRGTQYAPGFASGGPVHHLAQMSGRSQFTPFRIAPNNPPSSGELMSIINRAIAGFQ